MDPTIPGEIYIPSDDDMSDILRNAGHAYHLYLHSDDGKDDNDLSLDDTSVLSPGNTSDIEILQSDELAYFHFSFSSREHNISIDHCPFLDALQAEQRHVQSLRWSEESCLWWTTYSQSARISIQYCPSASAEVEVFPCRTSLSETMVG